MKIMVIYAKTGGGHESVAKALREGFEEYHPDVEVSLIDIVGDYSPFPISKFPEIYPMLTKRRAMAWKLIYQLTDGRFQTNMLLRLWWPILKNRIRNLLLGDEIDLIVSVYPLLNKAIGKYVSQMEWHRPKFAVLVTDLGTAHAFWISEYADIYIVPTAYVAERLIKSGIPPEKLHIVGLPVGLKYFDKCQDKKDLRRRLRLSEDRPIVLVLGGAEGMGDLEKIMKAINERKIKAEFVVVTGRNEHLQEKLNSKRWDIRIKILGFVNNLYLWMKAADLLLTKAGPSTISEALASGLPIIITGYLPGQEKANVDFVLNTGAGIYISNPIRIAEYVEYLVYRKDALDSLKGKVLSIGLQNSTQMCVDILYKIDKHEETAKSIFSGV